MAERSGGPHEPFIALAAPRDRIKPPLHVRSTLIASSLRSIRAHGLWDEYLAHVDPPWRETIVESVAGVWLPIAAGIAHYGACDALPLSSSRHVEIGHEVGDRVNGTLLGIMVRTAKTAGATPWTALSHVERLYARLFDGGGIAIEKAGPKDARFEMVVNPLARFGYFRDAARGMWASAIELFCKKAYVTEIGRTETSFKVKLSWV
jgi:hypothetical protein